MATIPVSPSTPNELDAISQETDLTSLKRFARNLVRDRDAALSAKYNAEAARVRLQTDLDNQGEATMTGL